MENKKSSIIQESQNIHVPKLKLHLGTDRFKTFSSRKNLVVVNFRASSSSKGGILDCPKKKMFQKWTEKEDGRL